MSGSAGTQLACSSKVVMIGRSDMTYSCYVRTLGLTPSSGRHPRRHRNSVPQVYGANGQHEHGELVLIEVGRSLSPDFLRYLTVFKDSRRLGQRQRRALGIAEEGSFPPDGHGEQSFQGLAGPLSCERMHVHAKRTAVDLARSNLYQLPKGGIEPAFPEEVVQRIE